MQPLSFLLFVLLAFILQTAAFNYIAIYGIKPDLVLILVILNGFLRGPREGAFLGFAAGILQDLVSGGYFGLNALTKMTSGYLAGLGEGRLYRDNRVIAAGLTWICTLGAQLVFQFLLLLVNVSVPVPAALAYVILPTAFYNALVVLLIYGYFYRYVQKDQSNNAEFFNP
ncbi:rod shape-determining protein MreD [Sporotomaculum syntrophicum]|uniref:Rod shape-determining protein MreD n=1 Tax=Sporotomaculum syntrophicum TaxID=182264 RepID=A0A9D2WQR1_9FIRM|nr:rod shape-determining protein MreD [Sporotomaculum syntrophicum]KAF1085628.1 rod shape-determining protein MreD [Sporotomaculum syntrophicum]